MKRITLLFLTFISLNMKAQIADVAIHNAIKDSIVEYYNQQKFAKIYGLLSEGFQSQMTENELIAFFKNDIHNSEGKITKADFLEKTTEAAVYKLQFEKSVLKMNLTVNNAKRIDGFSFVPFKEIVKATSNNPMQTDLDRTVDSMARLYIDKENTAGMSIGILKGGKTVVYHYGESDKTTKKIADNNTLYEIGSITKTFTGIIFAHAVLEKKIDLETDIRKYLSE